MIPTYRVDESGVFENTEGYEIEIELNSGQKDQFVDKSKLQYIGCAKARLLKQGKETELSLKACLL